MLRTVVPQPKGVCRPTTVASGTRVLLPVCVCVSFRRYGNYVGRQGVIYYRELIGKWPDRQTDSLAFQRSARSQNLLTPLHTSSRGAGPGSENAASLMPDPLLGTVFLPTFIKSVTLVYMYLNSVLKLNYSVEHIVASFVSAPRRFVNSASQISLLFLLFIYFYYY